MAAYSQAEVSRRQGRVAELIRVAFAQPKREDVDEYGRQILIGYDNIRNWMRYWSTAKYVRA